MMWGHLVLLLGRLGLLILFIAVASPEFLRGNPHDGPVSETAPFAGAQPAVEEVDSARRISQEVLNGGRALTPQEMHGLRAVRR